MGNKPNIKKQVPVAATIDKPKEGIVFGFSELSPYSYVEAKNDGTFFIDFLARLKKLCSIDWNTINVSGRHSFGKEKNVCQRHDTESQVPYSQRHGLPDGAESQG